LVKTVDDDNIVLRKSPVILRIAWQDVCAALGVAAALIYSAAGRADV
jgi:hypothetical protein